MTVIIDHPPDTLITTFVGNEIHRTAMTFADLQRLIPGIRRDGTPIATIEGTSVVVCWKPLAGASNEERTAMVGQ